MKYILILTLFLLPVSAKAECYGPYFVCKSPAFDSKYNAKLAKALRAILKEKK